MKCNQKPCSTKQIKVAGKWWEAHDSTSPPAAESQGSAVGPLHRSLKTPTPVTWMPGKEGPGEQGHPQDSPLPKFCSAGPFSAWQMS